MYINEHYDTIPSSVVFTSEEVSYLLLNLLRDPLAPKPLREGLERALAYAREDEREGRDRPDSSL